MNHAESQNKEAGIKRFSLPAVTSTVALDWLSPQCDWPSTPSWQHGGCEVDGFYWTVLVPDIVNSGREEQGSILV